MRLAQGLGWAWSVIHPIELLRIVTLKREFSDVSLQSCYAKVTKLRILYRAEAVP